MNLLGVEIFAVGKWQGQQFKGGDLEAMVAASRAASPVLLKLGHGPIPLPNPARADNFRLSDDGSKVLADFLDLPDVVGQATAMGLYRSVSVEIGRETMSSPWMITAVAILGAETPAVKSLAGLQDAIAASATPPPNMDGLALVACFSVEAPKIKGAQNQQIQTEKKPVKILMTMENGTPTYFSENRDGEMIPAVEPADMALSLAATRLAGERGIAYDKALLAAMRENPDLATEYKNQGGHFVSEWR